MTQEQLNGLEPLKDQTFSLGVVKKSHVNKFMTPDGEVHEDTKQLITAISRRAKAVMLEASDLLATAADLEDDDAEYSAIQTQYHERMKELDTVNIRKKEIQAHLDEKRFFIMTDAHMVPQVYLQCATDDNPDLPPKKKGKQT